MAVAALRRSRSRNTSGVGGQQGARAMSNPVGLRGPNARPRRGGLRMASDMNVQPAAEMAREAPAAAPMLGGSHSVNEDMTALSLVDPVFERAEHALAEAHDLAEVIRIRDQAQALRVLANRQR